MFNYLKSFIVLYMDMSVIMSSCRALLTLYMVMSVPITSCRALLTLYMDMSVIITSCRALLTLYMDMFIIITSCRALLTLYMAHVCHQYILQGLLDIVYGHVCPHYILQGLADIVHGHVYHYYILQGLADIVYGPCLSSIHLAGPSWHCIWSCLSPLHLAGPCWHCIWPMSVINTSCRALLTLYMAHVCHQYIWQGLADIVYGPCLSSIHLAGPCWHCIWPMSVIIASCKALLTLYMAHVCHQYILQGLADIVYGPCLSSIHLAGPCWHCIWPMSVINTSCRALLTLYMVMSVINTSCRALLTLYMAHVCHQYILQGLADIVYGPCLSSIHLAGPCWHCIWPMSVINTSCRALLTLYMAHVCHQYILQGLADIVYGPCLSSIHLAGPCWHCIWPMSVINTSCRALLTLYMVMSVPITSCGALLTLYMAHVCHQRRVLILQGLADIVYGPCLSSIHLAGPCWHCIWPMSVINTSCRALLTLYMVMSVPITSCRALLTLYMAHVCHQYILQGLADIVYGPCLSSIHLAGPCWHCIWPMSVINTSCRALLTLYMAHVCHHCILQGLADIVYGPCLSSIHLAGPCWHCIWPMSVINTSCRALLTLYMDISHPLVWWAMEQRLSRSTRSCMWIMLARGWWPGTERRWEKRQINILGGRGAMKLHLQWQPSGETLIIFTNLYSEGFLLKPLFLSK